MLVVIFVSKKRAAVVAAALHDKSELVKSFCATLTLHWKPDSESETMM